MPQRPIRATPFAPTGKRNTEAIEIGPNTLIAARIVEYKAAAPRPFDEIKGELRQQLVRKAASDLAQEAGRAKIALLNEGKSDKVAGLTFGKPLHRVAQRRRLQRAGEVGELGDGVDPDRDGADAADLARRGARRWP